MDRKNDNRTKHSATRSRYGSIADLLSKLYREIGISAVVAALEATAHKPQKPVHNRKDLPAVLRDDEAV